MQRLLPPPGRAVPDLRRVLQGRRRRAHLRCAPSTRGRSSSRRPVRCRGSSARSAASCAVFSDDERRLQASGRTPFRVCGQCRHRRDARRTTRSTSTALAAFLHLPQRPAVPLVWEWSGGVTAARYIRSIRRISISSGVGGGVLSSYKQACLGLRDVLLGDPFHDNRLLASERTSDDERVARAQQAVRLCGLSVHRRSCRCGPPSAPRSACGTGTRHQARRPDGLTVRSFVSLLTRTLSTTAPIR